MRNFKPNPGSFAGVTASFVILLAGALGAVWAFVVPIFQAPDEPAHFDYAISILTAHRLITLADGRPDWIVNPYTKYLMRVSDFDRIAWHSSMRVPAGYGSKAYFASIADGARHVYAGRTSGISYVAPLYPFGFYAAEALWLGFISLFSNSIVTLFFSARLLCVFFLMAGLYFNYRTALNLRIPPWVAVAIVAAIGAFPLTSFVSSYVQPDNLSYALVSASLYYASMLRRPGAPALTTIGALGVAIGLLAVTKYQFFLATALPAALMLAIFLRARTKAPNRIAAVTLFAAPAAISLSIQYFFVDAALHKPPTHAHVSAGPLAHAAMLGAASLVRYLFATSANAFTDFFVAGGCAATYWQVVGWFDTPIVIMDDRVEFLIRGVISLATLAVAVALGYFTLRNAAVLCASTLRRHGRLALKAAGSDPVFNSYLVFVAFMFALYVVTNNGFGAEGRHWYPFVFPAFLCFVWYAPRLALKRVAAAPAALACTLLLYCTAASGYALADVLHRYYSPPLQGYVVLSPRGPGLQKQTRDGVLWPVESADYHVNGSDPIFSFPRGTRLLVEGSLRSPDGENPSQAAALLDGRTALPVLSGQYQYRVAEALHSAAAGYTGFFVPIDTGALAEGPHVIEAYRRLPGNDYRTLTPARMFFLTRGKSAFSASFARDLAKTPAIPGTLKIIGACGGGAARASGTWQIRPSGVLLLTGSVSAPYRHSLDSVWLDVDGVPLPARFMSSDGVFDATVPAALFAGGQHTVVAFALNGLPPKNDRIAERTSFTVRASDRGRDGRARWYRECDDPLRRLAGT